MGEGLGGEYLTKAACAEVHGKGELREHVLVTRWTVPNGEKWCKAKSQQDMGYSC